MSSMFIAPASVFLLISTVIISFIALKNKQLLYKLMFNPYAVAHKKKYYLLLTSGFIHADLAHLLFNMLTFYFFAFDLERIINTHNFLILYFCSLFFSHVPTLLQQKNNYNYRSLGASGAISGILFSSILLFPNNKIMMLPIPLPIPAVIFGIVYLVWCRVAARRSIEDNINHSAHFAGAITGIIISFILFGDSIISIWKNFL